MDGPPATCAAYVQGPSESMVRGPRDVPDTEEPTDRSHLLSVKSSGLADPPWKSFHDGRQKEYSDCS